MFTMDSSEGITQQPLDEKAPLVDMTGVVVKKEETMLDEGSAPSDRPTYKKGHVAWVSQLYRQLDKSIVWTPSEEAGKASFECSMLVDGDTFTGKAATKREARIVMCERLIAKARPSLDTAIRSNKELSSVYHAPILCNRWIVPDDAELSAALTKEMHRDKAKKNPCQALEIMSAKMFGADGKRLKPVVELTADGDTQTCKVTLGDKSASFSDASKKVAKTEACRALLVDHLQLDASILQSRELMDVKVEEKSTTNVTEVDYVPKSSNMIGAVNEMFVKFRKEAGFEWVVEKLETKNDDGADVKPAEGAEKKAVDTKVTLKWNTLGDTPEEYSVTHASLKTAKLAIAKHVLETVFKVDVGALEADQRTRMLASPLDTRSAAQLLNELLAKGGMTDKPVYTDIEAEGEEGKRARRQYRVRVTIGDVTCDGVERSKKLARIAAAEQAVKRLFNVSVQNANGKRAFVGHADGVPTKMSRPDTLEADTIANAVKSAYLDLCIENGQRPSRLYAAFVLRVDYGFEGSAHTVVALASGRHSSPPISTRGTVLTDTQPEVLAKRALQAYLYAQVMATANRDGPTIFYRSSAGKLALKSTHSFHLFTNALPPADATARLACNEGNVDQLKWVTVGLLYHSSRFYGASGNACNIGALEPQTWSELQSNGAVRTMSVTDKLTRWSALGVQGALLTQFMGPVAIATLTIVAETDGLAVQHAIGERLVGAEPAVTLRSPFLQMPTDVRVASTETGHVVEHDQTLVWSLGASSAEMVSLTTGVTISQRPSAYSRASLFALYARVLEAMQMTKTLTTYNDAKKEAVHYAQAAKMFDDACESKGLGKWQKKPLEFGNFAASS